jgi:di/tricarboxylate transporter
MNNVGALALLMPVAIWMSRRSGRSPSLLLMPLAFGSLVGGLITLIGTPPNIIIALFREETGKPAFGMFDFSPVGAGVALAGLLFIALLGWRLTPRREGQSPPEELFEIDSYISEVLIPEDSKFVGQTLFHLTSAMEKETEAAVVDLVRRDRHMPAPSWYEIIQAGDILLVEAAPEDLKTLVDGFGTEVGGSKTHPKATLGSEEISASWRPSSPRIPRLPARPRPACICVTITGSTCWPSPAAGGSCNVNWARRNWSSATSSCCREAMNPSRPCSRTSNAFRWRSGDCRSAGPPRSCWPAGFLPQPCALSTFNVLPVQIAFVAAAVIMMVVGLVPLGDIYESIDWPVIVLLGAMFPLGHALESTGGARLIAEQLLILSGHLPPMGTLAVLLVGTMLLSNVVNNAAAAVLMAPIAITLAEGMAVSVDPLLMAVAVGASCAF